MKIPRLVLILLSLLIVFLTTCVACRSIDSGEQFTFSCELREQLLLNRWYLYIDVAAVNSGDDIECKGTKEDQFGTATLLPTDQANSAYVVVHDFEKSETLDQVWRSGEQCHSVWFIIMPERISEGSYLFTFTLRGREYTIPVEVKYPLDSPEMFSITCSFDRSDPSDFWCWLRIYLTVTNTGDGFQYVGGVLSHPLEWRLISSEGLLYLPDLLSDNDLTLYTMRKGGQYHTILHFRTAEPIPDGLYDLKVYVMGKEYTIPVEIK